MKFYVVFLSVLFGLLGLPAQAASLWQVTGNGLNEPSYVFGTMHMICAEDFTADESMLTALASTDTLVMELDINSPVNTAVLMQQMNQPGGPYLERYLDEAQYAQVNDFFIERLGMPVAGVDGIRPFFLMSMMTMSLFDCDELVSYEEFLTQFAHNEEMTIKELETVEFQVGIFDSAPLSEQVHWLYNMVADPDKGKAMVQSMTQAYLSQDMEAVYDIMIADPSFEKMNTIVLDERNQDWIVPFQVYMHTRPSFIAVGAGHLGGELGVLSLLKQEGYTLTPVVSLDDKGL